MTEVMLHEFTGKACVAHSAVASAAVSSGQAGPVRTAISSHRHQGQFLKQTVLQTPTAQFTQGLPSQAISFSPVLHGQGPLLMG